VHPSEAEWDGWSPREAARRLAGVEVPWGVSAGWAIDLFLGKERREHEDLEIAVPADRFDEVAAAFGELEFHVIGPATAEPVETAAALLETHHQTWGLDRSANVWRIDVFREPHDGDHWLARRDESIRLPTTN
jgi:hypothetical protein